MSNITLEMIIIIERLIISKQISRFRLRLFLRCINVSHDHVMHHLFLQKFSTLCERARGISFPASLNHEKEGFVALEEKK